MEKRTFNPNDFNIDQETGLYYDGAINEWCVNWEVIRKKREISRNKKISSEVEKANEQKLLDLIYEKANGQNVITVNYEGFIKYNGTGEYVYLIAIPDKKTYIIYDGSYGPGINGYKKQCEFHENIGKLKEKHPEEFLY